MQKKVEMEKPLKEIVIKIQSSLTALKKLNPITNENKNENKENIKNNTYFNEKWIVCKQTLVIKL